MAIKRVQKKIEWTPEDRQRHKNIRAAVKGRLSIDELIASGELSGHFIPLSVHIGKRIQELESGRRKK